jgi:D-tyrosyl-tRNA(Tyr) deacylase
MKAVIQRVKAASVSYENIKKSIGKGLVVLLGVGVNDTEADAAWLANKILNLRIFSGPDSKFSLSASDVKGEILVISQFTLFGDCSKGRRPDFTAAARPDKAEALYNKFVYTLRNGPVNVETGKFAADMLVEIHNDGPVTIISDTERARK